VGGLARFNGVPCMVLGHQKGRDTKERTARNFGMSKPEGYRKALRLMKTAEKFKLPVFTFVDTPGAYPGIDAEERGQSEAIGRNIFEMAQLEVPIIVTIIGEGGSGGALAISVGDQLVMLQYSIYSVISPEGCASILWKTSEKAQEAADALGITAHRLKALGLVDKIVNEPVGGAHRDHRQMAAFPEARAQRCLPPGQRPEAEGTAGPPLRAPAELRPLQRHQGRHRQISRTRRPGHEAFERAMAAFEPAHWPLAVGFSGGADSTALLAACASRWPGQVVAFHVHHGLQAAADDFERHCVAVCERLGVPLVVHRVDARHAPGDSPEDTARRARYEAFGEMARSEARVPMSHR
jgi:hypothetical protein